MRQTIKVLILSVLIVAGGQLVFISSMRAPYIATAEPIERQGLTRVPEIPRVGITVGDIAPDFTLKEISGKIIKKADLKGQPTLLWFTTTWCITCQIGAEEVKQLDDDFGGNAFNVVMIFIDPRDDLLDMASWKVNFGNDDWLATRVTKEALADYQINYIDTQYLLDGEGAIQLVAKRVVGYERYKEKMQTLLDQDQYEL